MLSPVSTIREARSLVEAAGAPSVGILLDTWHLWETPDLASEISGERRGDLRASTSPTAASRPAATSTASCPETA